MSLYTKKKKTHKLLIIFISFAFCNLLFFVKKKKSLNHENKNAEMRAKILKRKKKILIIRDLEYTFLLLYYSCQTVGRNS